jgi:hypothetical protein
MIMSIQHMSATSAIKLFSAAAAIAAAGTFWSPAAVAGATASLARSTYLVEFPLKAPVGHRQPRQQDVPYAVPRQEDGVSQDQKKFDRQLSICQGC